MANIGNLTIIIGANTNPLDAGLQDALGRIQKFGKAMLALAGFASLGAAAYAAGEAIKHAVDQADEMGKAAQKFGVPIEDLSKLKYAADLSGVSFEDLGKGVGKLSKQMSEFAGGSDEAGKGFRALGVGVTDANGHLRSSSDVMADIAGKFAGMKDGAGKTALAMDLFGKSGANLIPLLNAGKTGLKEMTDEAAALGLVITEKTYKAAEEFNDNLTRLGKVKEGIALTIMAQLVPALQTLTGMMVDLAKQTNLNNKAGEQTLQFMTMTATGAIYLVTALRGLGDALNRVNELATALGGGTNEQVERAWKNLGDVVFQVFENLKAVPEISEKLMEAWAKTGKSALDLAGKTDAPALAAKNFQKVLDDLRIKTIDLQQGFAALAPGFVQQAISLNIMEASAAKYGMTAADLAIKQQQLNAAMWGVEGQQLRAQSLNQYDQFPVKLQAIDAALAANAISSETHARLVRKAAEDIGNTWEQVGASVAGSLQGAADALGHEYSSMAAVAKIAGAAQALINAYIGASNALASGIFPANLAAAASVLAAGIGFAVTLKSVAVPALAQGGSFTVPGGISGVDNRMMTLALAAGEHVTVTPSNQSSSGARVEIEVFGIEPQKMFTGDAVRGLIEQINGAIADGATIKVAKK